MRAHLALFGCCAAVLAACDSPSGPATSSRRVAIGDTVTAASASDSARTYSFVANSGTEYAVLFDVITGSASLIVSDSASGDFLASVVASGADHGQVERWTANFARAGVLLARIQGVSQTSTPPFRFLVHPVNLAPESRPARLQLGDTVSDAIDIVPDVDTFVAHGDAGQELVGWIEALNTSGNSVVNIAVVDPTSGQQLGGTFHAPNEPNPRLAALSPLPASGDYTFRVPAGRLSGFPQYMGPYRFHFFAIRRAPESLSATIPAGVIVSGEALDVGGDIDEFTFAAAAGEQFNAFIRSTAGFPISLQPLGQIEGGSVTLSDAADTSIFEHGTGRFKALTAGNLGLRVMGPYLRNAVGAYQLYLYHVDPNPETASANLTPGDTVSTESIDLPGDLDEFSFTGSAGDQFNLFFSPLDPVSAPGMLVTVRTPTDSVITLTQSASSPADFWEVSTGRFVLPSSGTYHIRVDGPVGRYRLFLYPVNPAPESLPSTFAFGDSMSGEAIDVPGDVDEFSVAVAESSWATLVLTLGNVTAGNIYATLVPAGSDDPIALVGTSVEAAPVPYGPFHVTPGSYVLRVLNLEGPSPGRGSYDIRLYKFKDIPETVSSTIVLGDTISGEVLNPPGDFDRFYFHATRRDHVNIAVQGLGPSSATGVRAFLTDSGAGLPIATVVSPSVGASLDAHQTARIDPPRDGWYRVMISAGALPLVSKSYRLAVTRSETAPEHTTPDMAPGDSVIAEEIDYPGDWDEYTVTGTPGQHVALAFSAVFTTSGAWILVFDPTTGDSLATEVGQGARLIADVTIPAGGALKVAVFERPSVGFRECFDSICNGIYRFTGPYQFRTIAVNIPPENVPATYTVGDTVRGEAVAPAADIDEFTVSATPGQQLTVWWRLTAAPTPQGSLFQLRALDASTRTVLGGNSQALSGTMANLMEWFRFVVPASGNVLIRVQGYDPALSMGQIQYEFVIKP